MAWVSVLNLFLWLYSLWEPWCLFGFFFQASLPILAWICYCQFSSQLKCITHLDTFNVSNLWLWVGPMHLEILSSKVVDTFELRSELAVVGLHHPYQAGIEYLTERGNKYAVSIVQSGRYDGKTYEGETQPPQSIVYIGQGENPEITKGSPTDQKAERGNLALMNNKISEDPVRLIRRYKLGGKACFVYDGLYTVLDWQQKTQDNGKLVFEFSLQRVPGQPTYKW